MSRRTDRMSDLLRAELADLLLKSVHDPPASIVFQTCEVWKPIMVT